MRVSPAVTLRDITFLKYGIYIIRLIITTNTDYFSRCHVKTERSNGIELCSLRGRKIICVLKSSKG
jgi:hypothetical protein